MPVVPSGYGSVTGFGGVFGSASSSLRIAVAVAPPDALIVGVPGFTLASVSPGAAVTVTFDGQAIVGGFESKTVTVKLQLAPFNSDCETTECVPTVKNEPDAGLFVIAPQFPVGTPAP